MSYDFLKEWGNKAAARLNLSEKGAIELTRFSEAVHFETLKFYSQNKLVQSGKIERPLRFYCKLCHATNDKLHGKIDYGTYNKLAAEKNFDAKTDDYLPPQEAVVHKPVEHCSPPCELDPIYEGFIMVGLLSSGLFDNELSDMVQLGHSIIGRGEDSYLRAFLEGTIYRPDLASIAMAVLSLIDEQYSSKTHEGYSYNESVQEYKKRATKAIYEHSAKLYRSAQD